MVELIGAGNPRPTRAGSPTRRVSRCAWSSTTSETWTHCSRSGRRTRPSGIRSLITILPPHGPVETRIRIICRQRRRLFEAIGPVLRASSAGSPAANGTERRPGRATDPACAGRSPVTLAPEIDARGPLAPVVLDTIDVAAGWQNWTALRIDGGHTASSAEQVMAFAVSRLLRLTPAQTPGSTDRIRPGPGVSLNWARTGRPAPQVIRVIEAVARYRRQAPWSPRPRAQHVAALMGDTWLTTTTGARTPGSLPFDGEELLACRPDPGTRPR